MSKFDDAIKINVNDKTEKKGDLTYLSWAWAWAEFKKIYPDATYEVVKFGDGKPYYCDEKTGYMCYTKVRADGREHEMWLPVMDGANKAMKTEPYQYTVKNPYFKYAKLDHDGVYRDKYGKEQTEYLTKTCEAATMFDVNKTIMRCLTKNLAMFGLGLYIYAGEDLPEADEMNVETYKELQAEINRTGVSLKSLATAYKVKALDELSEAQAKEAITRLKAKPTKNAGA